ncbi:beta-galactosidase [Saliterribacillus persicus]|uniref:Beta-galactosidase-like protein n=1 Tax=Saliterribacillus persicus TaxID=930114 RepID=A0A368X4M7_9BACI|nr:beta-galactosidase [Saliterribacillus persicus]RCW62755.1 beta-galactosidase-like protein [Saliterribacillus persicus]
MANTLLFYDETFPFVGERPPEKCLGSIKKDLKIVNASDLAAELDSQEPDTLILLHGPYFPKHAWSSIIAFLEKGNGFVNVGGRPFRHPVYQNDDGTWQMERAQTAYHRQLHIHEILKVDPEPIDYLKANQDIPLIDGKDSLFSVEEPTDNFILHVTRSRDLPEENGSSGPMDAHIYPLLTGVSQEGREVAAPVVLMENTKGAFAGGRWIFINQAVTHAFWTENSMLEDLLSFIRKGVTEIWIKPNYAMYEPGEKAMLTIQSEKIVSESINNNHSEEWNLELEITLDSKVVWTDQKKIVATDELQFDQVPLDFAIQKGLYQLTCTATSSLGEKRIFRQGFWGKDEALLQQGSVMEAGRDYFWKDGRPFPIVGQTYMTSDVARKFIVMPNVAAWDHDMATMKNAGINFIRTGLWTGWRQMMFVDGHPSEEVLRAIDAFLLTAKKYDIEVTFNFFAFTPIAYEGENPYLDPRSIKAQKRFIRALVSRHAQTTNVQWDLINEPSMFDPKRFFQGPRSAQDKFEHHAFVAWLKERHKSISALQERWDMTPEELSCFEAVTLPEQVEINFDIQDMKKPKKGLRFLDYTLFTMEMHNQWAKELSASIKSMNTKQLVTVGQDEALSSQRPTPFFYQEAVDYTTVHSWWLMDQLVWDGIFTKTPLKPNLIQETGIMYVETADSKAKRSELELRNILERKYAYAFSTGGAGAVQWLWNTNFYMNNTNESNIGALRADGTQKPEADVSYDFGKFINEIRDLFEERTLEEIVVIFPYSNDFSNRKFAFEATTKLTRVLNYDMNVPFRGMSEYHLEALEEQAPKLIIVPSAHNFSNDAKQKLFSYVEKSGATLLWTGPVGLDAYWNYTQHLLQGYKLSNVLREEVLKLENQQYPVSFGERRIGEVNKEVLEEREPTDLIETTLGKGKLLWCSLPVELNERTDVLHALYQKAINEAGVNAELEWLQGEDLPGVYGRKLAFKQGSLYLFVSEYAVDTTITVKDPMNERTFEFLLPRERSILFATDKQGDIISSYRNVEIDCL